MIFGKGKYKDIILRLKDLESDMLDMRKFQASVESKIESTVLRKQLMDTEKRIKELEQENKQLKIFLEIDAMDKSLERSDAEL